MRETKLLPCPFCGGEAEMLNYSENSDTWKQQTMSRFERVE